MNLEFSCFCRKQVLVLSHPSSFFDFLSKFRLMDKRWQFTSQWHCFLKGLPVCFLTLPGSSWDYSLPQRIQTYLLSGFSSETWSLTVTSWSWAFDNLGKEESLCSCDPIAWIVFVCRSTKFHWPDFRFISLRFNSSPKQFGTFLIRP